MYQHKKLTTLTVGVQRIAVILPMEEQEGEEGMPTEAGSGSQLQEEPGAEDGSYRSGEELRRGQTNQVCDGLGQEGASPKRRRSHYAGSSHRGAAREEGSSREGGKVRV